MIFPLQHEEQNEGGKKHVSQKTQTSEMCLQGWKTVNNGWEWPWTHLSAHLWVGLQKDASHWSV